MLKLRACKRPTASGKTHPFSKMRGLPAAIFAAAESDDAAAAAAAVAAAENSASEPVDAEDVLLPVLPVLPWLLIDSKVTFPAGLR